MRPPILFLTVAFGVGLWAGLDPFVFAGAALWGVALPLIAAAACLAARAPLGAAVGIMGVAGLLWGTAAARARRPARCARRAQHGALRHTSADRERARVRPQRGTRFRYPRALRAIGSRAPPLHLRAARWVHGRLARPHSRQTAPRGARPLR